MSGQPLVRPAPPPSPVQIARLWSRQRATIRERCHGVASAAEQVGSCVVHEAGASTTPGVAVDGSCSSWAIGKALKGQGSAVGVRNENGDRIHAARRIRTCNQGIQVPSRFHEAWTISSSSAIAPASGPSLTPGSRCDS